MSTKRPAGISVGRSALPAARRWWRAVVAMVARRRRMGSIVVRGRGVVRDLRLVMVRCLGAVLFVRLRGRGLLVLLWGSGHLAAARCGSRQRRGAKGRAGESDGRDLDYVLVHVTPFQPFRAILPLQQVRRVTLGFLTRIFGIMKSVRDRARTLKLKPLQTAIDTADSPLRKIRIGVRASGIRRGLGRGWAS